MRERNRLYVVDGVERVSGVRRGDPIALVAWLQSFHQPITASSSTRSNKASFNCNHPHPQSRRKNMSHPSISNYTKQQFSLCPTNGRLAVGDGAFTCDNTPSVLAVCHIQGTDDMYYYSTTFSGGPGVRPLVHAAIVHINLLRPSGVFDIPTAKCPPDGGSSDRVTGGLASIISQSPNSSFSPSPPEKPSSPINNHVAGTRIPSTVPPRRIPARSESLDSLSTPSLTPDDSDASGAPGIITKHSKDALDLLLNIFPHNGLSILPFAKSVVVSVPNMGATFDGVVLELPGNSKTFYVDGKNAPAVSLRESIVALLELADEYLQCSALVIVLDKSFNSLNDLLHSLMYVGGSIVTKPPFQVNPAYILVGLDI
ncbi:ornithine decarboxylase antizyme-domain-containing protein [Boletus reticuloceps]|uniref:Ornithine decarboxylase antizyme n=1 Tax=Boletus reticuloceps TaxID=495285 RepID=A0A8I2YQ67_9AGAM|nr:ornithine decarboxylase antizyme-domain-containing protein [Boletus reticuloceps]